MRNPARTCPATLAFLALTLFFSASSVFAADIYVSPAGGGDGSLPSPTDLQSALDTARTNGEDDTIHVMEGAYDPSGGNTFTYGTANNDNMTVVLSGGWSDDFTTRSEDVTATRFDATQGGKILDLLADVDGVDYTFEVENVTFENGSNDTDDGGAIRAFEDFGGKLGVKIRDCLFRNNQASTYGGALYMKCHFEVYRSTFLSNSASSAGAVHMIGPADLAPVLEDCVFEDNHNTGWQGSTIFSNVSFVMSRCTVKGRIAGGSAGGGSPIYQQSGGAPVISNSVFQDLVCDYWGSAIQIWLSGGIITNCLFLDCKAGGPTTDGYGTIAVYDASGPALPVEIVNCTFVGNRSRYDFSSGGAIDTRHHATMVVNCVFWDNGPVSIYRHALGAQPTVSHSFLDFAISGTGFSDLGSNIESATTSPFRASDDYRPAADSVVVDAGDNDANPLGSDLAGSLRIVDGDGDGTDTIDMGAYEIAPDIDVTPADLDFGVFDVDDTSPTQTLTVSSQGAADLVVGTITIGGDDAGDFSLVSDDVSDTTLTPGSSATVGVEFTPSSGGPKSAVLTIPSNDPDTPSLEVPLGGSGAEPPLVPEVGTIGTECTVTGAGFGTKKGKVYLEYVDAKGKRKTKGFKVLEWAEGVILAYLKAKMAPGKYDLEVQTKEKGAEPVLIGTFEVSAPVSETISATSGLPGDEVSITGLYFGDKKAKAKVFFEYEDAKGKVKRKKMKVVKDSLDWNPVSGKCSIRVLVPKLSPTTGNVVLANKIGEVGVSDSFEILSGED
jgi:predicted outer membrane repeat protein